jgi:alpha-glucosidase
VPVPWSGDEPPFGFGPEGSAASWLPAPASWRGLTVEAESADPDSMLELYRSALRLRHRLAAEGIEEDLRWLDAPEGVLAFVRGPGLVCTVNLSSEPVVLTNPGTLLLSSAAPALGPDATVTLPADSAAWWRV